MRRSPITAVVLRRVGARQRGLGATVEGARILAFVLTIPFGGCELHVRDRLLLVFWGGFGAWLKPKIKFAWFVRNILGGRCFWVAAACRVLRVFVRFE